MARLVVHLPGRALDRLEDDVLVEARDHAVRQGELRRIHRVELRARGLVLPGDDLVQALGLHDADRGGELVQAEVEAVAARSSACRSSGSRARARAPLRASRPACRPRPSRSSWSARTTRSPRRPTFPAGRRSTTRRASGRNPRSGRSPRPRRAARSARPRTRCGRRCAPGTRRAASVARTLRSRSSNDMQRSSRLQSTNSTCAPAWIAASGVAMNVFDGQSTVWPRTPAHSSAASAAPVQPLNATAPRPFQAAQRSSNSRVSSPSDQRFSSRIRSHNSCRRSRSRWSKPIAKRARFVEMPGASIRATL